MKYFTQEEKELIANTKITRDCFEMSDYSDVRFGEDNDYYGILNEQWDRIIYTCNLLQKNITKQKMNVTSKNWLGYFLIHIK